MVAVTDNNNTKVKSVNGFKPTGRCLHCEHFRFRSKDKKLPSEYSHLGPCRIWTTLYEKKKLLPFVDIDYTLKDGTLYVPEHETCLYFAR